MLPPSNNELTSQYSNTIIYVHFIPNQVILGYNFCWLHDIFGQATKTSNVNIFS